jgi:cardiolipin synthase
VVDLKEKFMLWLFGVAMILCLAGVFSFRRLPTIVPDLTRRHGRAVQLQGEQGPLSASQSKAIIEKLQARGEITGIFDRHLALEEAIVGSPLTTGNKVLLLKDGPVTYQAMLAAIEGARDHINMETYILEDDEVGQRFAQALIDKQTQGVKVNLIRDSVGTLGTPTSFFTQLTDNGIDVLEFNPVNPVEARRGWEVNGEWRSDFGNSRASGIAPLVRERRARRGEIRGRNRFLPQGPQMDERRHVRRDVNTAGNGVI